MWKKNNARVIATHRAEVEIFKAVAQAWLSHHNANPSTLAPNEFDARKLNFRVQPSRFRIEASSKSIARDKASWDFNQSLLDPYEILAVSKRLEEGLSKRLEERLVFDEEIYGVLLEEEERRVFEGRKRKESKNSLRNLFNMVSGRSKFAFI